MPKLVNFQQIFSIESPLRWHTLVTYAGSKFDNYSGCSTTKKSITYHRMMAPAMRVTSVGKYS